MSTPSLNLNTIAYNSEKKESTFMEFLNQLEVNTQNVLNVQMGEPASSTPGADISSNHWRLYFYGQTAANNTLRVAEIIMTDTPAGATLCVGGTPLASTTNGANVVSRAFDGSAATFWESAVNFLYEWVSYQFTSNVFVREIRIQASTIPASTPTYATLQYSPDNGVTWISYMLLNLGTFTLNQTKTFTIANNVEILRTQFPPRFWRVNARTVHVGTLFYAAELAFSENPGDVSNTTGGVPFLGRVNGGGASTGFDNNTGTNAVVSVASLDRSFLAYHYIPTGFTNRECVITSPNTPFNSALRDFSIDYSTDGVNWTIALDIINAPAWVSSEVRRYSIPALGVGDRTISEANFKAYSYFNCNPVFGTRQLSFPTTINKIFTVRNSGAGTVQIMGSPTFTLNAGETVILENLNGTLTPLFYRDTPTFLKLSDTPSTFTGSGLREIKANSAGTAIEFGLLHNLTATVSPTANEDANDGYAVGSMWFDTTARQLWICTVSTVANAVWIPYTWNKNFMAGFGTTGFAPTQHLATGVGSVSDGLSLRVYPFQIFRTVNITSLYVNVRAAGSADSTIKLGMWRNNPTTGLPTGVPVASNNTPVPTNVTGVVSAAVSFTAIPDIYWIGILSGGTTNANITSVDVANSAIHLLFGATTSQNRAMAANQSTHSAVYTATIATNITTLDLTGLSPSTIDGGGTSRTAHVGIGW